MQSKKTFGAGIGLWAVLFLAAPHFCLAQSAPPPFLLEDEKGWQLDKPQGPTPGNPAPPSPGSPAESEWQRFWERMQNGVFDDICRNIKLPVKYTFSPVDPLGVEIGVERRLARYADGRLATIDYAKLGVSLGATEPLTPAGAAIPMAVSFSGRADGAAYVIRPIEGTSTCKEIKTLIDLRDYKTVVDLKSVVGLSTAGMISADGLLAMKVGEIWKLPLVLTAQGSLAAGVPLGAVPATISVSLSYAQGKAASVHVFRLNEDQLGFRVRLDSVEILSKGISVSASLPAAGALGLDNASGFLEKEGDRLLLREVNRYIANSLGFDAWKRDGRKAMVEFILSRNDRKQMERLAEFLRGKISPFGLLASILKATGDPEVRHGKVSDELARIEKEKAGLLGPQASFSGASDYQRAAQRFQMRLPFLVRGEFGGETQTDAIVSGTKDFVTHINQASSQNSNAWVDIPFFGQFFKKNSQRTVQAMARVDNNGVAQAPFLAYIQQDGFMRHGEQTARQMVVNANDILRLAGTRGEGETQDILLPVDELFARRPLPKRVPPPPGASEQPLSPPNPLYRSAVSAFTVIFNQKAIEEILWAPAETVVKAFMQVLSLADQGLLKTALEFASIADDGGLNLDKKALNRKLWRMSLSDEARMELFQKIKRLARRAAGFVQDLVEARGGGWKERTESLVKIVSGKGNGGLKYDDAIKALVQLTERANLFGEFRIHANKKIKGEKDISARYLLHAGRQDPAFLEQLKLKEAIVSDPPELGY